MLLQLALAFPATVQHTCVYLLASADYIACCVLFASVVVKQLREIPMFLRRCTYLSIDVNF